MKECIFRTNPFKDAKVEEIQNEAWTQNGFSIAGSGKHGTGHIFF